MYGHSYVIISVWTIEGHWWPVVTCGIQMLIPSKRYHYNGQLTGNDINSATVYDL